MNFKSLKIRIAFVFLSLILVIQVIGAAALRYSIETNANSAVNDQLKVGEKVLLNLLEQNGENLTQAARILATDYGFRQAIGSHDSATILSALSNHQARINADIAMFYSSDADVIISGNFSQQEALAEVKTLIKTAVDHGNGRDFKIFKDKPYQFVAVPVKAPRTIGWIIMGFEINDTLVRKLNKLSHLDVTFLYKTVDKPWQYAASTLSEHSLTKLIQSAQVHHVADDKSIKVDIGGVDYGTRYLSIFNSNGQSLLVALQRSLDKAKAPYNKLGIRLLLLTVIGAVAFVIGILYVSKIISDPISKLAESAKKLEAGQYDVAVDSQRNDEIGKLGRAFNSMSEAIALREQNILKLAYFDELTGLPNRASFMRQLGLAYKESREHRIKVSVVVINLVRFKQINNVLGHDNGNQILFDVAQRIKTVVKRTTDFTARLAGDEFVLLLPYADTEGAVEIALRLNEILEHPIEIDGQKVDISANIGIATMPDHAENEGQLLAYAEMAMHTAKLRQTSTVVYDKSFNMANQDKLSLASDLRVAIGANQFNLYVQPKIDLITGKVCSLEALIRWVHPSKGFIFPDQFIPFAEQTGFIQKISLWMLDEAVSHYAAWSKQNVFLPIAVNLSTRDLIDQDLPAKLQQILTKHNMQVESLSLEITESGIMNDPQRAQNVLEHLSKMGFKIAIDDFGTGYSSLAYLKSLPVNELKIDKSFVLNMSEDISDSKIVRSTIDLGHNLNLKVVAEGIENTEAWAMLEEMGCDFGQGYFISRPMPAKDFLAWLADWNQKQAQLAGTLKSACI